MPRVLTAKRPYSQSLDSLGNASHMLIRQIDFPDGYLNREMLKGDDHDRIQDRLGLARSNEIFQRHTGCGELGLKSWVMSATKEQLIAFISEYLGLDQRLRFTGCRVLGTTNRSNGHPIWTLELFRKSCSSKTATYSTADAPNVTTS